MSKQVSVSFHKPSLPRSTPADGIIQVLTPDPEEWKQRAQQRPDDQSALIDLIVFALLLIVLLMILRNVSCQSWAYLPGGASQRRVERADYCIDTRVVELGARRTHPGRTPPAAARLAAVTRSEAGSMISERGTNRVLNFSCEQPILRTDGWSL
jgi:hypothetical protein